MTKEQAKTILELHKTIPQPIELLVKAIKVLSEIKAPTGF